MASVSLSKSGGRIDWVAVRSLSVCGARRGRYVVRREVVDVYKRCELDARSVGMSVVMASMPTGVSCGALSTV